MNTRIRQATKKDVPSIAHVDLESYRSAYREILPEAYLSTLSVEDRRKRWTKRLKESSTFTLVAEDNAGKILGFVYSGPARKHDPDHAGEVYAIYILPGHQRAGIGRALMTSAAERLSRIGINSLLLWVVGANPARKFYEAPEWSLLALDSPSHCRAHSGRCRLRVEEYRSTSGVFSNSPAKGSGASATSGAA